ncbi:MAG: hypothetical protein ACF8Q5_14545 [Phycisphaerales bacterium JB040]
MVGRRVLGVLAGAGLAFGLAGGGCSSYTNINTAEGVGAVTNPNARVPSEVVREALRYVITRYPSGDAYAVNLLPRTNTTMGDFILRELPAGVQIAGESNRDLPTYHVGTTRVRGGIAKVDIIRPVIELGEQPGGGWATQGVTVHLDGGINPWRVERIQRWAFGAVEVPEITPLVERGPQGVYVVDEPAETDAGGASKEETPVESASVDDGASDEP